MDKIITILIVIIGVFLGSYVWYYIMNRLVCMNCGNVVGKRQDDKDNKKNK